MDDEISRVWYESKNLVVAICESDIRKFRAELQDILHGFWRTRNLSVWMHSVSRSDIIYQMLRYDVYYEFGGVVPQCLKVDLGLSFACLHVNI